jgi:hypothetical protein
MATGSPRSSDRALLGAGIVMVLCCAVGPAVIGTIAGGALGGWLGVLCAVVVATVAAVVMHRGAGRRGAR